MILFCSQLSCGQLPYFRTTSPYLNVAKTATLLEGQLCTALMSLFKSEIKIHNQDVNKLPNLCILYIHVILIIIEKFVIVVIVNNLCVLGPFKFMCTTELFSVVFVASFLSIITLGIDIHPVLFSCL